MPALAIDRAVARLRDALSRGDLLDVLFLIQKGMWLVARNVFYRLYLPILFLVAGMSGVNHFVFHCGDPALVLTMFGAQIGRNVRIGRYLIVHGVTRNYRHLSVADNVYIGPNCFLDLTHSIVIHSNATISARCVLLTHLDVGDSPLKERYPDDDGPIQIDTGAYLGTGTTVLHGTIIGESVVVGAGAVVTRSVPAHTVAVGVPARPIDTQSR